MKAIDIFCDVIDNFGDAGVCWRLARDIRAHTQMHVRLFINEPGTLAKIAGNFNVEKLPTNINGIEICRWDDALVSEPADAVIETFGCRIPEIFEKRIAARKETPIWINLEYLSAEDWVEGCHTLPSPHPTLGISKYYFFPGFTHKTGGVIREKDLDPSRDRFKKAEFLKSLGADPNLFTAFLFSYPQENLSYWYDTLTLENEPLTILAAPGKARDNLLSLALQRPSEAVRIISLPMVPQERFDWWLWASDTLIVRGEDSFVRAQLAAKPFIWNIYPQSEETHIVKLKAFADRMQETLGDDFGLWTEMNLAWNRDFPKIRSLWPEWKKATSRLQSKAAAWDQRISSLGSLTENLCNFLNLKVKSRV